MSGHVLRRIQVVPADMSEVFGFFEEPRNLEAITPPWLHFEVTSASTARVGLGTEISYRLRWQIFPMTWHSRISEYEPGNVFADEMLRGPYARWYHTHHFESVGTGVRMTDVVEYTLPLGPLGGLVHVAVVKGQLDRIFDYRRDAIARLFDPASRYPA